MKAICELKYPFTPESVRRLRAGDLVRVSGRVFTGRDRLHKHLFDGNPAPADLKGAGLFHCGPVMVRAGGAWAVRAAGPTTSIRCEPYLPEIIRRHALGIVIGKGGMGPGTARACAECGCVYLHTIGGAAQVLADRISKVLGVFFLAEFGAAEAMWELELDAFPAMVTMDAHGRNLHDAAARRSQAALARLIGRPGRA